MKALDNRFYVKFMQLEIGLLSRLDLIFRLQNDNKIYFPTLISFQNELYYPHLVVMSLTTHLYTVSVATFQTV